MDTRDALAGMALTGLLAYHFRGGGGKSELAKYAYEYADAMLEERVKGADKHYVSVLGRSGR